MISAGGTGGGVYPALSVAGALRRLFPDDLTLTFIGARGDMARDLVAQSGVTFDGYHEVLAGPLHGIPRLGQLASSLKIVIGTLQGLILALRLRPQVLFLTGGWTGVPMALACWLLRRPIVIYVPDIEPGLMLRVMGRNFAHTIAATKVATGVFFPGKTVVEVGYPLRPQILEAERQPAIEKLGLDPARQTLLVFGGSKGSRSINTVVCQHAPALLAAGLQIVHISGRLDWDDVRAQHAQLSAEQQAHYRVFDFLPDIGEAFAAADLVISRAGAATLAEYPAHDLPAILVPYPYAWRYQKVNAEWLVERGGAIRLDDNRLESELMPTITGLFADTDRLDSMRQAMRQLKSSEGAPNLARLLARVARRAPDPALTGAK
jgi:UDP-N-acetylglucosamine--N-acetylmuramyl-(pentapeptide) pyrophosphoryl-undecaprenol N-acetylglucosamine transferase